MFEVGKAYDVVMYIDGEETTLHRTVEKYEHPLVKFEDIKPPRVIISLVAGPGHEGALAPDAPSKVELPQSPTIPGEIVNVTSPSFVSAKRRP